MTVLRSFAYSVAGLLLGTVWFTVLVTGWASGAGLLITLLGLPVVWLTLVAAQTGGQQTLADLTRWVDDLGNSTSDRRDGLLTITSGPDSIAEIHLPGLMPLTGLSLVGERRSVMLQVQSFDLALTP